MGVGTFWLGARTLGPETDNVDDGKLVREAERVLRLLEQLSERTFLTAIDGISHWLSTWEKQVKPRHWAYRCGCRDGDRCYSNQYQPTISSRRKFNRD